MYNFESNTKQFLNFLKFLAKLSTLEQRSFIDNATNERVNMLVSFIGLCSSGKVLCNDQKLFNRLAKYNGIFFDLKMAKKCGTAQKVTVFKQILCDKYGLLNLLAPYLEQCLEEYRIDHQLGVSPIVLLPKMLANKRTKTKRRIPACRDKQEAPSRDEDSILMEATDDNQFKGLGKIDHESIDKPTVGEEEMKSVSIPKDVFERAAWFMERYGNGAGVMEMMDDCSANE